MNQNDKERGNLEKILNVTKLSVTYHSTYGQNTHAVYNADFELRRGESMGIAGESACGKSTLGLAIIRMLTGKTIDVNGDVTFEGKKILDIDESEFDAIYRWKKISMIFQGAMNSLDPVFSIHDQFIEILRRHDFEGDHKKTIMGAIESVGLADEVLDKYPHELSGGMKQRVVIAMALLLNPRLVIADEPTTALDVLIQAQIVNMLKSLKRLGMSFILITHDLAVLSEIVDRVGVMYGGQIVEWGTSKQIYQNPRHPYTQGLLKSIPTLKGERPGYMPGAPPRLWDKPTRCRFIERCPQAMEKCNECPPKFETETGYVRCWLEDPDR